MQQVSGSYRLDGDRIAVEGLAMTRMACITRMEQEETFLDVLANASRWRVRGAHLDLFDAAGALLARFEAIHMQ